MGTSPDPRGGGWQWVSLEDERGGVGGVKATEGVVWHSPGTGLSHQKLVLQKCPSRVMTCPLPLPLVSHRSPFSWGAQLFLPVPAARYDADDQLKALPALGAVLSPGLPGRGGWQRGPEMPGECKAGRTQRRSLGKQTPPAWCQTRPVLSLTALSISAGSQGGSWLSVLPAARSAVVWGCLLRGGHSTVTG